MKFHLLTLALFKTFFINITNILGSLQRSLKAPLIYPRLHYLCSLVKLVKLTSARQTVNVLPYFVFL